MNLKRLTAAFLTTVTLFSHSTFPIWAQEIGATRGEAAQMLLQAADDYNPDVQKTDIIKGYEDGQLHEERGVTRAEALVMLKRAFGTLPKPVGHNARMALASGDFNDIPDWAKEELAGVFDAGIAAGTAPGTFSPDEPVTKEQMNLFIDRVFALYGTNEKDDFFATVNKEELETLVIPEGQTSISPFTVLQDEVDDDLWAFVNDDANDKLVHKYTQFYTSLLNREARDKIGTQPIDPLLSEIKEAKDLSELMKLHRKAQAQFHVPLLLGFSLTKDYKNNSYYLLSLNTYSPLMPYDFYYYGTQEQKEAYYKYLRTLLTCAGQTVTDEELDEFLKFETYMLDHMISADEASDLENIYNLFTAEEANNMFSSIDLSKIWLSVGFQKPRKILIEDVGAARALAAYLKQENVGVLSLAMHLNLLHAFSSVLDTKLQDALETVNQEYFGVEGKRTDEEIALSMVKSWMSAELGWIYQNARCTVKTKADVTQMVESIIQVYEERIDAVDWMSEQTKERAKKKLSTLKIRVAYPEWDGISSYNPWADLEFPENNCFSSLVAMLERLDSTQVYLQNRVSSDRDDDFYMSLYEVNAAYIPTDNAIELPAAILQKPFYDEDASYEENLGGIGYVIAHEITHAFDNIGAQFDENGNLSDWWTPEDYDAFAERCAKMAAFYNGYEAAPGILTDGWYTLSENVADQGAIQCITEIASRKGDVDFQKLYRSLAKVWASTSTREYALYTAYNDTHAPGKARVNRVVVNCKEFYEAFGITEKDGMWVPEEERVSIW